MRCGVYVRVSTDDQRDNGWKIWNVKITLYCPK